MLKHKQRKKKPIAREALVAETILASVHVRAHQRAGHMGARDLMIKALQDTLRGGARPHMGLGRFRRMGAGFHETGAASDARRSRKTPLLQGDLV